MPLLAIAALAAGTYVFRLAGPLSGNRLRVPRRLQHLLSAATAVLLTALVATAALTQGHGFAGWARPAGVLVAGALAIRRAPFPVVVAAAAATTALLRLAGIPLPCHRPPGAEPAPDSATRVEIVPAGPGAARPAGLPGG